jgi:[acyl-carrier-protein] S-malonyltransferase
MHTPHLQEVAARLRDHLSSVPLQRPRVPLVGCHDGRAIRSAEALRGFLSDFLALPVRWETTVRALRQDAEGAFVEVGPGDVLSKMLPFIDRSAAIRTASDLLDQKR